MEKLKRQLAGSKTLTSKKKPKTHTTLNKEGRRQKKGRRGMSQSLVSEPGVLEKLLKTARSQKKFEKPEKKITQNQYGQTCRPYIEYIDLNLLEPIEELDSNLPSEVDRKIHKTLENEKIEIENEGFNQPQVFTRPRKRANLSPQKNLNIDVTKIFDQLDFLNVEKILQKKVDIQPLSNKPINFKLYTDTAKTPKIQPELIKISKTHRRTKSSLSTIKKVLKNSEKMDFEKVKISQFQPPYQSLKPSKELKSRPQEEEEVSPSKRRVQRIKKYLNQSGNENSKNFDFFKKMKKNSTKDVNPLKQKQSLHKHNRSQGNILRLFRPTNNYNETNKKIMKFEKKRYRSGASLLSIETGSRNNLTNKPISIKKTKSRLSKTAIATKPSTSTNPKLVQEKKSRGKESSYFEFLKMKIHQRQVKLLRQNQK